MGQYGNQPDFGTRAKMIVPTGNSNPELKDQGVNLNSAALYIGTGGTLVCSVVGGDNDNGFTTFTNIPNGTFFPVIVNRVYANYNLEPATTCSDIVALY